MKQKLQKPIFLVLLLIAPLFAMDSGQDFTEKVEIRGVYGNPKPLWDKGHKLNELGINAVFTHSGSINKEMAQRVRKEGAKLFAEFATLNGKNYVEEHPEAWAINEKGKKVEAASWFMGVCPNNADFRQYRFNQLKELLSSYKLDGVWMDYVHWHAQFEEPEPILPETCFCEDCLHAFSKATALEIPKGNIPAKAEWILKNHDKKWRDWRCTVIYDWSLKMREIIDEQSPETLLGLYHCPWNDEEFDGARRRTLGLDYEMLKKTIDVFSPMVYHARMGRKPQWVAENIEWFSKKLNVGDNSNLKIWPIVQAYDQPYKIDKEEFKTVLMGGLVGNSSGVMMFTTSAVAKDKNKVNMMKNIYMNLKETE